MKSFTRTLLTLAIALLPSLGLMANASADGGGEGALITAWADSAPANTVRIETPEDGPVGRGTGFLAEVHMTHPNVADLTLTNAKGEIVWGSSMVMDNQVNFLKIKIGELPKGFYLLKIQANGATDTQSLVVK